MMFYPQSEREYITSIRSHCWGWHWSCTASCGVSLMFHMSRLMSKTWRKGDIVNASIFRLIQCFTQYCIIFDELLTCHPQAPSAVVYTTRRMHLDQTGTGCPCTGWPERCTPVGLKNKLIWSVVGLFQCSMMYQHPYLDRKCIVYHNKNPPWKKWSPNTLIVF